MKRKLKLVLILLVVLVLTTACGKNGSDANPTQVTLSQEAGSLDPTGVPFAEKTLRVKNYIPLSFSEEALANSANQILSDAYGDKLYVLERDTVVNTPETNYVLHYFDMDNQTVEQKEFRLPLPEDLDYTIQAMEVTGENELSFKVYGFNLIEGETASSYLCKTDLSGALLEEITPFPSTKKYFFNSPISAEKIWQIPNGDTLITERDDTNACANIYTYDAEKEQRTLLATLDNEYIFTLCADNNENIYFSSNGYITKYNFTTEKLERMCSISEIGISSFISLMLISDSNELAYVGIEGEHPGIYLLTDEEIAADDTIQLTCLSPELLDYVGKLAGFFKYDSGHMIQMEQGGDSQDAETFRDRIMMEITQGKGPELLWVTETDMRILAEKGALMDLSQFVPQDVKEQLLPGVLQAGTVNDKLVGITPQVSFYTMTVPDSVWQEDSWTVTDMLDIMESGQDWEMFVGYAGQAFDSYALLTSVFCMDLTHSDYVDFEQGISYFNQEEFLRALDFAEKYAQVGANAPEGKDEHAKMLRAGKAVATMDYYFNGMQNFSSAMCRYGENCHVVGFPVNEGSGNYLYGNGYLVVNANATHLDEIKEFLAYMLDYDNQFTVNACPVRKDVIRDRVIINEFTKEYVISLSTQTSLITHLDNKPDGSTYLEEFMAFAESCVPMPYMNADVYSILYEELPAYYNGEKTKEQVADIIHRRVQLYLDENH